MTANGPDPAWGPPPSADRVRHRPSHAAYLAAAVGALVLVLALVGPLLAVRFLLPTIGRAVGGGPVAAGAGVGDPYFPDYGSAGYDALHYAIDLDWDVDRHSLQATTTITARATEALQSFFVDLALTVESVEVDGRPATFGRDGFQDVLITPSVPIATDTQFTVVITYSGRPQDVERKGVARPVYVDGDEVVIAGEPESAAWWFPSDDHPSDPATVDLHVTVPTGTEVVSIGELVSRDTDADPATATWHWRSSDPVATYLIMLGIGQYELRESEADDRQVVYAVSERLSDTDRRAAFAALERTPTIIAELETTFGAYPFGQVGGFVPASGLWFDGLENQTRPTYKASSIISARFSTELLVHELSHMWFGDHVTLRQWDDLFDSEAYASWSAWEYADRKGGASADDELRSTYDYYKTRRGFWRITMIDPGRDHLFDAVYLRGPMTLQALRNVIGDPAFFRLTEDWAQTPGDRSLEQWMVKAQSVTARDLTPFFDAWIYGDTAPADTASNGLR